MTKPEKQSKKMPPYRIRVKLEQFFDIEVNGKNANTAGKRINEWLKRDSSPTGHADIPEHATPCDYYWTPVEEMPYIVSGGELPDDPTGEVIHVWDGEKIAKVNLEVACKATFLKK
jgi:hypothetical protein